MDKILEFKTKQQLTSEREQYERMIRIAASIGITVESLKLDTTFKSIDKSQNDN